MKAMQYHTRRELDCQMHWPMYASYEEDAALCAPSWNQHFDPENGHHPVSMMQPIFHFLIQAQVI